MHGNQHGRTAKASTARSDRAVMHRHARSCTVVHAHARSCHGKSSVPNSPHVRREDEKQVAVRCVFAFTTNNNTDSSKSLSSPLPFSRRCAFDPGAPPFASPNVSTTLCVNVLWQQRNTRQLYFKKIPNDLSSSRISTDTSVNQLLGLYTKECVQKWEFAITCRYTKKRWKGRGVVKRMRKRIRKVVRSGKAAEWPQLSTFNDSGTQ